MPETTNTQAERLTRLETEMESMKVVLLRVETKLDTWQTNFVSKELLQVELRSRDEKAKAQDEKIERLEEEKSSSRHTLPLWAAVALSAVAILISLWTKR